MVEYAPTAVRSRAQWGATDPVTSRLARVVPADAHKIGATWHHSTGQTLGVADFAAWVRNIQHYHVGTLGYGDIAYGLLIDPNGVVYLGRDERVYVGAHAASHDNVANRLTHGVCFLGDLTVKFPSPAAQRAAFWCLELMRFAGSGLLCWEHREWATYGPPALPTACPGDAGARWVVGTARPFATALATG